MAAVAWPGVESHWAQCGLTAGRVSCFGSPTRAQV